MYPEWIDQVLTLNETAEKGLCGDWKAKAADPM